ncbi:MAG: NAD-dependent deacetylase [Lentisphaerae bacterium]|nr:MAG: NAD-dependent deacetylase [Lentisphaerota bacterium]
MYEELKQMLQESRRTLAFTGAGISTLSGIRDFRGKNGVYLEPWHGKSVEEILSPDCFLAEPALFYGWAAEFLYRLEEFHPAAVHRALAGLEQSGLLRGVYTQNIDLLHQQAGSRHVYELHGSPARHHCLKCRKQFGYAEIAPLVLAGKVPRCGCGGLVKPDIVFYGENLDEALLNQAFADMEKAELVLVLGSSLTVQPAASLPMAANYGGGKIVIVNAQPTPLDRYAALRYDDLQSVFEELENWLEHR